MKTSGVIILTFFLFCKSDAQQYQLPTRQLIDSFGLVISQTNKDDIFFGRLLEASNSFFSPGNSFVTNTVFALSKNNKIDTDSAISLIFDTVLHTYTRDHIWKEYPGVLEANRGFFEFYTGKLCPCLTRKIKESYIKRLEENDMKDCIAALVIDTSYINNMKRLVGTKTLNELYTVALQASIYAMQYCKELGDFLIYVIKDNAALSYMYQLKTLHRDDDKTIAIFFEDHDIQSLAALFPDHKKYEAAIKQTLALFNKGYIPILREQDTLPSGQVNFTNTYYGYKNEKPFLMGQVLFSVKELRPEAPVLSIKFISPDKIVNKAAILKKLEDEEIERPPPPPPIDLPPGVRIAPKKDQ